MKNKTAHKGISAIINKLQNLSHASESRVLAEMLNKQYQEFYLNIIGTAIVTLLFLVSIAGALNNRIVLIWCIAQWTLAVVHFVQCKKFLNTPQVERDYLMGYFVALVIMMISGLLWGLAPLAFFAIEQQVNVVVITGTAALILAGGLALVHLPGGYIAFGITAMSILVISMFNLNSDWYLIAYMGILGMAIMLKFSLNTNRSVADSISLRFKNKDLADELELANVSKSKFLATASHDLRQPLQALSLLTTAATEHGNADIATLDSMQRSVQNLNTLFNSLLDISKLDAGAIEASSQSVNISWLLDYIFNQFNERAHKKNVDYQLNCQPNLWVKTDPVLTQRILVNIIDNAFNNTQSGHIHINVKKQNDEIIISVNDSGRGIAKNKLEKIFTEFYQLKTKSNQSKRGMGLGLSIVKRLAELQSHAIKFTSEIEIGSQFSISLPLTSPLDTQELALNDYAEIKELKQKNILVIDNEKDVGEAMRILLLAWGYNVYSVENSSQALAIINKVHIKIDLIISDFQLDENINGLDLCTELNAKLKRAVPTIIVTGNTDQKTIKLISESQTTLLHKPIFPPQFRLCIENLLKNQ